jgi:hypothetical protein
MRGNLRKQDIGGSEEIVVREAVRRPKREAYLVRSGDYVYLRPGFNQPNEWVWAEGDAEVRCLKVPPDCYQESEDFQLFLIRLHRVGLAEDDGGREILGTGEVVDCHRDNSDRVAHGRR